MDIRKVTKDIASMDSKLRKQALSCLKSHIPSVPRSSYKRIAYGLFFLYYHSDGIENQTSDSESICNLFGLLKRASFIYLARTIFEVFKKLWTRIDYHRTNKYLGLVKDILKVIYKRMKAEKSQLLFNYWNKYLTTKLFGDGKGYLMSKGPFI